MQTNDSPNLEGSGNLPGLGGGVSGGLSPSVHTFKFIPKQFSRISVLIDGVEHIRSHFYLNNRQIAWCFWVRVLQVKCRRGVLETSLSRHRRTQARGGLCDLRARCDFRQVADVLSCDSFLCDSPREQPSLDRWPRAF